MNNAEDIMLMKEISKGSLKAFNIIYSRYSEAVYYTIYKKIKDKDEVDDVFQDFFASLWRKREHIRVETSFKAWLFTALRNHVLNHLLKTSNREKMIIDFTKSFAEADNELAQKMEIMDMPKHIGEEIDRLPEKMRQVWFLRKEYNMSISEISTQLNVSEQTIKNQLNTATKRLKGLISKLYIFLYFL